jgi:hypothetical protein
VGQHQPKEKVMKTVNGIDIGILGDVEMTEFEHDTETVGSLRHRTKWGTWSETSPWLQVSSDRSCKNEKKPQGESDANPN